nr:Fic family protein [Nannocystis pusilla]
MLLETRGKRLQLSLEWLKKLHQTLLPQGKKDQVQYRKDNPIHRMYFHDLAPADKISYRMRKLTDWFRTEECRKAHPIELAVEVHRELIRIFPWPDISGRVARLAMNAILIAENTGRASCTTTSARPTTTCSGSIRTSCCSWCSTAWTRGSARRAGSTRALLIPRGRDMQ